VDGVLAPACRALRRGEEDEVAVLALHRLDVAVAEQAVSDVVGRRIGKAFPATTSSGPSSISETMPAT
jgi:hypothetical protein